MDLKSLPLLLPSNIRRYMANDWISSLAITMPKTDYAGTPHITIDWPILSPSLISAKNSSLPTFMERVL